MCGAGRDTECIRREIRLYHHATAGRHGHRQPNVAVPVVAHLHRVNARRNGSAAFPPLPLRAKLDGGRCHGAIPMRNATFNEAQIVATLR
jgi:hypothetical protein